METTKTTLQKLEAAAPYNIFYNKVLHLPQTFDQNSITFSDLLCPSLGKLKSSLQITRNVDINWLVNQYVTKDIGNTPLTLLYTVYEPSKEECLEENLSNVTQHKIPDRNNLNTKMGIYLYEDNSLRVAIYTASLYPCLWEHFNLGIWVSPLCRHLPENASDTDGESATNFKSTLLEYMIDLSQPSVLNSWIDHIKRADFSDVRVFLVTSIPGSHSLENRKNFMQQVEYLLKQHCELPENDSAWPVIAQSSTLGKFGDSPKKWLRGLFLKGLSCHTRSREVYMPSTPLQIIYPTWKLVKKGNFSREILKSTGLYGRELHSEQKWIESYFHEWKADKLGRSGALPLTKTYCRISPTYDKMAWFLLTTANITKGGWVVECSEDRTKSKNHEVGVMFFPKFFDEEYFNVTNEKVFPLIYDLPLKKYGKTDHPWTTSYFPPKRRGNVGTTHD